MVDRTRSLLNVDLDYRKVLVHLRSVSKRGQNDGSSMECP